MISKIYECASQWGFKSQSYHVDSSVIWYTALIEYLQKRVRPTAVTSHADWEEAKCANPPSQHGGRNLKYGHGKWNHKIIVCKYTHATCTVTVDAIHVPAMKTTKHLNMAHFYFKYTVTPYRRHKIHHTFFQIVNLTLVYCFPFIFFIVI